MVLFIFLIAHFFGDFIFQSSNMAYKKLTSKRYFIKHCLIYSLCIVLALICFGPVEYQIVIASILIISHALIDLLKNIILKMIQKRKENDNKVNFVIFIIDQLLHIGIIIYAIQFIESVNILGKSLNDFFLNYFTYQELYNMTVIILLFIFCLTPAAVFIKKFFILFSLQENTDREEEIDMIRNGYLIGILERIIILCLWIVGQLPAIGFVIAAKSLARFKQLNDRDFAEKYLIGTLLSYSIALMCIAIGELIMLN